MTVTRWVARCTLLSNEAIDEENQLLIEMAQHDQVMGGSLDSEAASVGQQWQQDVGRTTLSLRLTVLFLLLVGFAIIIFMSTATE